MDKLCSVGLDVGTTTTQLIVSELRIENKAGSFSVPELSITDRRILYESPVHFTPLLDESHVDGEAIRAIVEADTAVTGDTVTFSLKKNKVFLFDKETGERL